MFYVHVDGNPESFEQRDVLAYAKVLAENYRDVTGRTYQVRDESGEVVYAIGAVNDWDYVVSNVANEIERFAAQVKARAERGELQHPVETRERLVTLAHELDRSIDRSNRERWNHRRNSA